MSTDIIQQVDVMPTVLGYLKYDEPFVSFGRNAFERQTEPFAFNYLNGNYQFFQGDYLLLFDGQKPVALYHYKQDRLLRTDVKSRHPELVDAMLVRLKAFIQQYNNRMVDDNLTAEGPQAAKYRPR